MQYYFEKAYVECIHILTPQIEDLIRNIIYLAGGTVLKPSKNGGFNYKTFEELLRDELFIKIFDGNVSLYLRAIFTDSRGWNVRNELCHGLINIESLNHIIADRLIHILLLLSLAEVKYTNNQE